MQLVQLAQAAPTSAWPEALPQPSRRSSLSSGSGISAGSMLARSSWMPCSRVSCLSLLQPYARAARPSAAGEAMTAPTTTQVVSWLQAATACSTSGCSARLPCSRR
jgi:hypothetical protein